MAAAAERVKDSLKYLLVTGVFFEELGFTYLGPIDGHDFNDLERNLQYAKKVGGPVLLHVITKKGKGYRPAEDDKIGTWHGTGPYKIETGDFVKTVTTAPSWSGMVAETVRNLARQDIVLSQLLQRWLSARNLNHLPQNSRIVSLMSASPSSMRQQWQPEWPLKA